jgi:nucleotide-sensitive chloride channel 1A
MPLTVIREPPKESSYTPLQVFQSETPSSFDTPVLHFRHNQCTAQVSKDHLRQIPIFGEISGDAVQDQLSINGIDVWITSE